MSDGQIAILEELLAQVIPVDAFAVGTRLFSLYPTDPGEKRFVVDAVMKRKIEFATGRLCAHKALTFAGRNVACIGKGVGGEPLWPEGIRGSISHCPICCVAVVCDSASYPAIGIDVEVNRRLPNGVLELISSQKERDEMNRRFDGTETSWGRLLFSVKESLVKTFYVYQRQRIDFSQYRISIEYSSRTFKADPVGSGSSKYCALAGRWGIVGDLIMTTSIPSPESA